MAHIVQITGGGFYKTFYAVYALDSDGYLWAIWRYPNWDERSGKPEYNWERLDLPRGLKPSKGRKVRKAVVPGSRYGKRP